MHGNVSPNLVCRQCRKAEAGAEAQPDSKKQRGATGKAAPAVEGQQQQQSKKGKTAAQQKGRVQGLPFQLPHAGHHRALWLPLVHVKQMLKHQYSVTHPNAMTSVELQFVGTYFAALCCVTVSGRILSHDCCVSLIFAPQRQRAPASARFTAALCQLHWAGT